MSEFLSERFSSIVPYTPGEQPKIDGLTKLNTNESPFPPSRKAIEKVNDAVLSRLNLYSDPTSTKLIDAVSSTLGVKPEQVIMGNGSDEILAFAFEAFCDEDNQPVFADITYGLYSVLCELFSLTPTIIPLKDDLSIDENDYCGLNKPIFIANPNAPTSIFMPLEKIEKILDSNPKSVVLIDEAYVDFGSESAVRLIDKHQNLIVCRTFSKSRNLAGARLGFAVANEELIADLNKMKNSFNPYNINSLTAILGEESIKDTEYFKECTDRIIETREYTTRELRRRGFEIPEPNANFIFAKSNKISGEKYFTELRKRKILVRHFSSERICDYVRITIGSKEQMELILNATDEILAENKE